MKTVLLVVFSLTTGVTISAQAIDSSFATTAVEKTYRETIAEGSLLFNGSEYYYDDRSLNGHPFLTTSSFQTGSVTYNGVHYNIVSLAYDILRDQLVAFLPGATGDVKMKLVTEKINDFSINDRRFIRLSKDSANNMTEGFYEVLYNGKTQLLSKRAKKIKEVVSPSGVDKRVEEVNAYFIKKNNNYYPVHSKSSLLDVLKDSKSQLSKYINQSDIRYNKNVEYNLIRAVRYFDQTTTDQ